MPPPSFARRNRRPSMRTWVTIGAFLMALAYAILENGPDVLSGTPSLQDGGSIVRLYQEHRSGEMAEGSGIVERVPRDDNDGSRHQRFILRVESGHTLLVSHNIDLASRLADLEAGDQVLFRGQYEWNTQGGILHWTHHDPSGRRPGGWLQHLGATYR